MRERRQAGCYEFTQGFVICLSLPSSFFFVMTYFDSTRGLKTTAISDELEREIEKLLANYFTQLVAKFISEPWFPWVNILSMFGNPFTSTYTLHLHVPTSDHVRESGVFWTNKHFR